MADDLVAMVDSVRAAGHIHGVAPHLIEGRVTHLQYADGMIILVQNNNLDITNLKFLSFLISSYS